MLDRNRTRTPLFGGVAAIAAAVALAGCTGTINTGESSGAPGSAPGAADTGSVSSNPNSGTGAGSGSGSSTPNGTGSGTGTGTSNNMAMPGVVNTAYARLTIAEYQATVKAAYGVDVPLTGLPDDDRVGPFTSNVSTQDPVEQFMLASEDLAAAIVPAKLPVCTAATGAKCIQTSYQTAIQALYRRPLSAAELTALAGVLTTAEASGLTSQDATRSMVLSTLLSANFLFRSDPLSGDAARGRRLAEHLGYALWDAPPDAALVAAGQVAASDLGASLKEQAARLGADARAVPVLTRFMGQWLNVDIDNLLTDPNAAFATSPLYAELEAFVKTALTTNMTVKSFANGTQGFIQKADFTAYGMTAMASSTDVVPVTWASNTVRRGVLGEELFMNVTRHPDPGRRPIYRGHNVRSNFLCQAIAAPPANVVCLNSQVMDRTTDTRCAPCHSLMDPIGKAFASLDLDDTIGSPAPVVNGTGEIQGTFADLPTLLNKIADSQSYADCFSKNLLAFFLEQSPDAVDSATIADVSAVVKSGGTLADAVGQAVVSLEKRSQSITPWCSAQ